MFPVKVSPAAFRVMVTLLFSSFINYLPDMSSAHADVARTSSITVPNAIIFFTHKCELSSLDRFSVYIGSEL